MNNLVKIVGIGDVAIDYYYRCDRWPNVGDKAMVSLIKSELGGMISNAISNLAKYGAEAYLVDEIYEGHREFIEDTLVDFNVKRECLTYTKENITTTTNIMLTKDERTIFINWSKKPRSLQRVQLEHVKTADCIYTTISDLKMLCNVNEAIMHSDFNGKIVLDLENNTFESFEKDKEYFDLADIIFINDHALEKLTCEIKIQDLFYKKEKIIVLTKGKNGCEVITSKKNEHIEGIKVNVVDTTGAGDMFNSTYVYALFLGKDPFESARIANYAAARSVESMGNKNIDLINEVRKIIVR